MSARGGVEEFAEAPRLVPPPGRRTHTGLGEQLLVVVQEGARPLLGKGVLPAVEGECVVQRGDAVRLELRGKGRVARQHGVEVEQHSAVGQSGVGEIPRHHHVRTLAARAVDRHVLQCVRPGQQRPNLDVGMPALKRVDDAQSGIRLVRVGGEEECQRVVVIGAARGGRQRQRRGAERTGAAQQRPPIEMLIETRAGVRGLRLRLAVMVPWFFRSRSGCGLPGCRQGGRGHHCGKYRIRWMPVPRRVTSANRTPRRCPDADRGGDGGACGDHLRRARAGAPLGELGDAGCVRVSPSPKVIVAPDDNVCCAANLSPLPTALTNVSTSVLWREPTRRNPAAKPAVPRSR